MSPLTVVALALVALVLGYRFYSRFLEQRLFQLRGDEPVPAVEKRDDVDFVPTRREVLWGHHFASIAGAAPILGPAMAVVWGASPAEDVLYAAAHGDSIYKSTDGGASWNEVATGISAASRCMRPTGTTGRLN